MEIGILSLSDIQSNDEMGLSVTASARIQDAIDYGVLADRLGLDIFALGEHHSPDFAVSSPAVVLAAIAARTEKIRLTSAVTVLPVLDPVRVYQDFATLDLISGGRAELIAGRSAFVEPFALFGESTDDYDELFAEKLELLLQIRSEERVTWSGRFRPPLKGAQVIPRSIQEPLPVWAGVGGSPGSAARAGALGLPMTLGYIGGPLDSLRRAVDIYRQAGEDSGHSEALRVGISTHCFVAESSAEAREVYPWYHEYLRPKTPGGRGFNVSRAAFEAGLGRRQALMIGSPEEVTEKILDVRDVLGIDRFFGQIDWGGLPRDAVEASITRLAQEVAPAIRTSPTYQTRKETIA